MGLLTPNPNGTGDDLGEELTEGDIVLLDENGEKILFEALDWEKGQEKEQEEKAKEMQEEIVKKKIVK